MNLDRHVAELQEQLASSAASGGEATRTLAEQLSMALDAATRLVLLEALSEAAGEITREIAPGSVEVRLRGRDPEFAVSLPAPPTFAEHPAGGSGGADGADGADAGAASAGGFAASFAGGDPARYRSGESAAGPAGETETNGSDERDDTSTSRTTLRLPDQLKARVEKAAAHDGLSLNTWLVRAIADALEPKARRGSQRETRASNTFTGWAR